jgi:hypothetical protein
LKFGTRFGENINASFFMVSSRQKETRIMKQGGNLKNEAFAFIKAFGETDFLAALDHIKRVLNCVVGVSSIKFQSHAVYHLSQLHVVKAL